MLRFRDGFSGQGPAALGCVADEARVDRGDELFLKSLIGKAGCIAHMGNKPKLKQHRRGIGAAQNIKSRLFGPSVTDYLSGFYLFGNLPR